MTQEALLSVGIDIGTTTTQLIFSRLTIRNEGAAFSVPNYAIARKEILYRSGIHFTPLLSDTVIDAEGVREIIDREYAASGFRREDIQTGAIIITGETARKENAAEVLRAGAVSVCGASSTGAVSGLKAMKTRISVSGSGVMVRRALSV